jgi:protoheme IX farnesyltransferase
VKSEDYAQAGVPMMPNALGPDRTRLEILLYTVVLAPVGVLPWLMGFASIAYGLLAIAGGAAMLYFAWRVYKVREGEAARKACMSLFGFSILYLFALFLEIAFENGPAGLIARGIGALL